MLPKVWDGTALACDGDVLIGAHVAPATLEGWKLQFAGLQQLAARSAHGVLYFTLILPSSSPPDAGLRATIQRDLHSLGNKLRRLVAVPIGDGVWLALVRTIIRSTLLLSGQSKQQIVEPSVERGLDRVLEFASPDTPARSALQADVDEIFRALGVVDLPS